MAAEQQQYDYDLVVVGGGSGGLAAAKEAARARPGLRVACFDYVEPSPQGTKWGLGGTCVNVGCIPKKLFHHAAGYSDASAVAANLGWAPPAAAGDVEMSDAASAASAASASSARHTAAAHSWDAMVNNVNMYIKSLNFAYKGSLRSAGVDYINGRARFVDAHTVEFVRRFKKDTERLTAERFILAPGGRPSYPDGVPGAREHGITSDDIFWMKGRAPGKTLVVGASYIALECAGFLHGLGFDTTVMVRSILLRGFDQQVAAQIGEGMERSGVRFVRPAVPTALSRRAGADGPVTVEYRTADGAAHAEEFDTVLFAVGRSPNTADLGLAAVGVATNARGEITVDLEERTTAPHVYAIGDVVAGPADATKRPELTPVAIQAGQLLARRLFGGATERMDYDLVPTTVFTPLEYGAVGLSQEEAEAKMGGPAGVVCYVSRFNSMEHAVGEHAAPELRSRCFVDERLWAREHALAHGQEWEEHERGSYEYEDRAGQYRHNSLLAKLVVRKEDDRVVGFHYLGPNAGEITQGFALAMRCGATKAQFDRMVGIHPTLAEEFTVMSTTLESGDNFMKKEGCGGGGSCG